MLKGLDIIEYTIKPELAELLGEAERHRIGMNADQLEQVIPEAVNAFSDYGLDPNPLRSTELIPWIIKALQQLAAKVA